MATYNQIIEGLEIIRRCANAAASLEAHRDGKPFSEPRLGGADHDILWACPIELITDEEDKERLRKLGWLADDASGCWSHYV